MNDPREIVRAALLFMESHDDPAGSTERLASAAKRAGLRTEYHYWTKVTAEIVRRTRFGHLRLLSNKQPIN